MDDWKREMEGLSDLKRELRKHVECTEDVSRRLNNLEISREEDQQHLRSGNLKISGIPEDCKNVYDVTIKIFEACGVQLQLDQIDVAHRVQSFNKTQPRPVIVRLVSRWKKDALMERIYKDRKRLTTGQIGLGGADKPLYVNEHLTPYYDKLARQARDLKKGGKVLYTWVRGGKVFIRKNESSPTICVKSLSEINRFT